MAEEPAVVLTTVAPRPTAVVAETTTWERFRERWPAMLDAVYAVVRARPELGAPDPGHRWQNVMLYRDDAPSVEVGVLVHAPFAGDGEVVASELPGGRVLTAVHRGDFAKLGRAHDAVHRFARDQGLELAGPRWEVYGHGGVEQPETEVFWLLR